MIYNNFGCIEGKGYVKGIHCSSQNAALFDDLLLNIFSVNRFKFKRESFPWVLIKLNILVEINIMFGSVLMV